MTETAPNVEVCNTPKICVQRPTLHDEKGQINLAFCRRASLKQNKQSPQLPFPLQLLWDAPQLPEDFEKLSVTPLKEWWLDHKFESVFTKNAQLYDEMVRDTLGALPLEYMQPMQDCGLEIFPKCTVVPSLYGMGGSYRLPTIKNLPVVGVLWSAEKSKEQLKRTIVHEMVHLSLGQQQENLEHFKKEAIVDAYGSAIMEKNYGKIARYPGSSPHVDAQIKSWINRGKSPREIVELLLN